MFVIECLLVYSIIFTPCHSPISSYRLTSMNPTGKIRIPVILGVLQVTNEVRRSQSEYMNDNRL